MDCNFVIPLLFLNLNPMIMQKTDASKQKRQEPPLVLVKEEETKIQTEGASPYHNGRSLEQEGHHQRNADHKLAKSEMLGEMFGKEDSMQTNDMDGNDNELSSLRNQHSVDTIRKQRYPELQKSHLLHEELVESNIVNDDLILSPDGVDQTHVPEYLSEGKQYLADQFNAEHPKMPNDISEIDFNYIDKIMKSRLHMAGINEQMTPEEGLTQDTKFESDLPEATHHSVENLLTQNLQVEDYNSALAEQELAEETQSRRHKQESKKDYDDTLRMFEGETSTMNGNRGKRQTNDANSKKIPMESKANVEIEDTGDWNGVMDNAEHDASRIVREYTCDKAICDPWNYPELIPESPLFGVVMENADNKYSLCRQKLPGLKRENVRENGDKLCRFLCKDIASARMLNKWKMAFMNNNTLEQYPADADMPEKCRFHIHRFAKMLFREYLYKPEWCLHDCKRCMTFKNEPFHYGGALGVGCGLCNVILQECNDVRKLAEDCGKWIWIPRTITKAATFQLYMEDPSMNLPSIREWSRMTSFCGYAMFCMTPHINDTYSELYGKVNYAPLSTQFECIYNAMLNFDIGIFDRTKKIPLFDPAMSARIMKD